MVIPRICLSLNIINTLSNQISESFTRAATKPDGLAVLAVLYKFSAFPLTSQFVQFVDTVRESSTNFSTTSNIFTLADLLPSDLRLNVLSYEGSLTTPPCSESVTWMIATDQRDISFIDLNALRSLKDASGRELTKNTRPEQVLNGRDVRSF